jgi:histidinol dehydrogenase
MGVIPARVAGVREVVLCSPAGRTGRPSNVVLAAAAIAGVDRVFAIGGAGAIGAMAYGTTTVPRVDRIVGPGNAYVAEAKVQVAGVVGTDSPAGPSELLVLADDTVDAGLVAREVIAQTEHDPRAAVVVVIVGGERRRQATRISDAVQGLIAQTPRRTTVIASLAERGALLTANSVENAVQFINAWAPEHLLLAMTDAERIVPAIRSTGTICVGPSASVVFGDYMTGANHVLPTGGLARTYGGLSTLDFVRWTTIQRVTPAAAERLAADVAVIAEAEHLPGHAAAARGMSPGERGAP